MLVLMLLEIPEIMRPVELFRQRMLQRKRISDVRPVIRKVRCVEDGVYKEMKTVCLRQIVKSCRRRNPKIAGSFNP